MSHEPVRHILHEDPNGRWHRVEICQDGYVGSSTPINASLTSSHPRMTQDPVDPWNPDEEMVKMGTFELKILIENATDMQLIEDIFEADNDEYKLVWRSGLNQNPAIYWSGMIDTGYLELREAPFPYEVTIKATDFNRLKGIPYTFPSGRIRIIEAFGTALAHLGYEAEIRTYWGWSEGNITATQDFMNQVHLDEAALQQIARNEGEDNEDISCYEVLKRLCENFRCWIKYEAGSIQIVQKSAFKDITSVRTSRYDLDGTLIGHFGPTNFSDNYDNLDITITAAGTVTRGVPSVKQASVLFDHRSTLGNIVFPPTVRLEDPNFSEVYTQSFFSDGTQRMRIEGEVEAFYAAAPTNSRARMKIKVNDDYWDGDEWQATNIFFDIDQDLYTLTSARAFFQIDTDVVPDSGFVNIEITLQNAIDDGGAADLTEWRETNFVILNKILDESETRAILNKLIQAGGYTANREYPAVWLGDGPRPDSVSALTYNSTPANLTGDEWGYQAGPFNKTFFNQFLLEEMDAFRNARYMIEATVAGWLIVTRPLVYRGRNYIVAGWTFYLADGNWRPLHLLEIKYEDAPGGSPDDFEILNKY